MASCRIPMSEIYDLVKLRLCCKLAAALETGTPSRSSRDSVTSTAVVLSGSPNDLEKPTGSTTACAPVNTAAMANTTLTSLKIGRR